jgi:uncharacterized protein with FMN-binding domain
MRKVTFALIATAVGVFLVLSYKSHSPPAATATPAVPGPVAAGSGPGTGPGTGPDASGGAAGTPGATGGAGRTGTFTGAVAETPYGPVQVRATLKSGKLTDVTVLQETDGSLSRQIDARALPILKSEALAADSWNVDTVSGATYTSLGYSRSLQSVLDQAGTQS